MTDPGGPIEPTIDLATVEDVADLARLRWELYAEQEGAREPIETYTDRFVGFALQALASDRWRAWVARGTTGPVAAMWLQTVARVPVPGKHAGPIGYLTNVYVSPDHRDRGLGTRMLERVLGWCRGQGYSCVITWPAARSRPFYRRGGFDRPDEPFVVELVRDEPR
jgi:GNAT superfamily N-acetyltransferase